MSKLNPEDLNVTSFETGDEVTMLKPPICTNVSDELGCDSVNCSKPEPETSAC